MAGRHETALDPEAAPIDGAYYAEIGDAWWDRSGPLRILHDMNPARVAYFDAVLRNVARIGGADGVARVLDVGCGGGLVSEALARLGHDVTGMDISDGALDAARRHAHALGVAVDYREGSAYSLPAADASYDAVVVSDVLEHLHDLPTATAELARVLRPGGVLLFDTINRTVASRIVAILVAERLLGLVRRGTHDWRMFIRPAELRLALGRVGLDLAEVLGISPAPLRMPGAVLRGRGLGGFVLHRFVGVSYIGHAVKPSAPVH